MSDDLCICCEETFEGVFEAIYDEALELLIERQRKYGPENIAKQGLYGVTQRIVNDKLERILKSLNGRVTNGRVVLDEIDLGSEAGDTLTDAYIDVANYALICVALLRGKWGKPLEDEVEAAADEPYHVEWQDQTTTTTVTPQWTYTVYPDGAVIGTRT